MKAKTNNLLLLSFYFTFLVSGVFCQSLQSDGYKIEPVIFTSVNLTDNFWSPRIQTNHDVTIPFTVGKLFETGRIKNFEIAAGLQSGNFCTVYTFDDTDVYKVLEGMSYSYQIYKDKQLDLKMDSIIEIIAAAQEPDGYIFTNRTIMGSNGHEWSGAERWEKVSDLSHELYNIGHLIEAGIAHYYATGKRSLLDVAISAADRVCEDFGPEKITSYPGHQIIELAMAKLFRLTGEQKYLDMGKFLLDTRGPGGSEYNQAHEKVINQRTAVGHAVRATYMYAGMAEIAALTNDASYINAIDNIWADVIGSKLYVTGGIGATGNGEAFGDSYVLPNLSAYNETCASIANIYWNYRLFLLHGESKYIDVLERTLYNAFLSGVSLEGNAFFYPNPLESHGQHQRSPWFSCACCPGNVTRFVPSVGGYFYAKKGSSVYVNLFAEGSVELDVESTKLSLFQKTEYPWKGDVEVRVSIEKPTLFELNVRIPGWSQNQPIPSDLYSYGEAVSDQPEAFLNGDKIEMNLINGYLSINRKWTNEDKILLKLPINARVINAHDNVEDDKGKMAVQRGPLIYTAEWPDNNNNVLNLVADPAQKISEEYDSNLLNGVVTVSVSGYSTKWTSDGKIAKEKISVKMIPYYAWAHRGAGEMQVWLPTTLSATRPLPFPSIASKSTVSSSSVTKGLQALNDQIAPRNSNDHSIIFFHWWPMKDTTQWVQYDLEEETLVSSSKVYWFDDGPNGGCRIPLGWKLLYKKGNDWFPVENLTEYVVKKDTYSTLNFKSVNTTALRMEVILSKDFSGGIMEWIVN